VVTLVTVDDDAMENHPYARLHFILLLFVLTCVAAIISSYVIYPVICSSFWLKETPLVFNITGIVCAITGLPLVYWFLQINYLRPLREYYKKKDTKRKTV
jgi:predicted membrane metal-binding protein